MKVGYVRSVHGPAAPYPQVTRLIEHGCAAIYIETSSGDHLERPVLHRAVEALKPGDVLVVGDGDRLSRNAAQTDIIRRRVERRGAALAFLDDDPA